MAMEKDNRAVEQPSYVVTRWLFLRLLGLIYLSAFGSYAFQIIGLNGMFGVLPTADLLVAARDTYGDQAYWFFPTVEWLNSSDFALQAICWGGTALSVLVILGVATGPVLCLLCILWLSLCSGGGEFTGFQSDGMLVETTILTLFFVPWQWFEPPWPLPYRLLRQRPPSLWSLWLLRFMVFRLMFASGLVKILSGDSTWRDLTALDYHFETQPIPTPLAWYAHWAPEWLHKLSVLGMYVSEVIAPACIFLGRYPRIIAAALMALLHLMISLTGNYTFLNFLCMLLCLPLLDDRVVARVVPEWVVARISTAQDLSKPNAILRQANNVAVALLIGIAVCRFTGAMLLVPEVIRSALRFVQPFHLADSYGLFAVMTTTRPEIVFEGSQDGKTWKAYEFKYKVGDDLRRPPPLIAPHMPRLDWRLWFAAMEPVQESPWVLGLVRRLLQGAHEVDMFFVENPFPGKPPLFIRAFVYDYHFSTPAERSQTGCWWRRDHKRVYLPPTALTEGGLIQPAGQFEELSP
jgi:lipase maturation factor 1